MKRKLALLKFRVFALCALAVSGAVMAQSQSPQAMTWFKLGLTEQDPQKKIAAYMKALELDPQFVEAYYNVGMAFKKQQDYRRAEQYLHKALAAKPEKIKTDTKLQILFELATTYKKLGKADDAEEALGGAKGIAMEPAMKAAIAFELGRLFYDGGKYPAALAELRAGRGIAGANQGQFDSLIQLAENEMELQRLFETAEKAKAGGNWRGAKALYEQVRAKNAGYKDASAKIAELDALLNAETQKNTLAVLYDQAVKQAGEDNFELAIKNFESVLQESGGNYKDAKTRLETARQQLALKQQNEELENHYAAGLAALKARNWTRAIVAFENVLNRDRNYRDARKRLAESKSGLERESTETSVARYYAEGVAAMNKGDRDRALAAFEKVRKIDSNYREVTTLMAEVENASPNKMISPSPAMPADAASAVSPTGIDSLYRLGVVAADEKNWVQAVINLEKVRMLQPDYRDVINRLAEARANLALVSQAVYEGQTGAGSNISTYVGGAAALLVLPLLGFAMFSPAARARFQLFRGNYPAAARIYEKALTRQPKKVKLYPALASVYLTLGRNDENAIKVYKTILQLNLNTRHRDEMSTIVAQNYLIEGRTDSDAIEVLESALKAEQRRQGQ